MKYFLLFGIVLFPGLLFSQDKQSSQHYSSPLSLNPAYTGFASDVRAGITGRTQFTGLKKSYNSAAVFTDFYFKKLNSGFGLILDYENFGKASIEKTDIKVSYSYHIPFNDFFNISFGLQVGYIRTSSNYHELLFEDQYNRSTPGSNVSNDPLALYQKDQYFDFSSGIVLYGKEKYWIGLSLNHLNTPAIEGNNELPLKSTISGGINFFLNNIDSVKSTRITPTFVYKNQDNFDQIDIGVYGIKTDFLLGLFYRRVVFKYLKETSKTGLLSFQGGLKLETFLLVYSFDYPVSGKDASNLGNSHEITLILKKNKSKKTNPLPY